MAVTKKPAKPAPKKPSKKENAPKPNAEQAAAEVAQAAQRANDLATGKAKPKKTSPEEIKELEQKSAEVAAENERARAKDAEKSQGKPKSTGAIRNQMMKPAYDAKLKQDSINRAQTLVENDLVKVELVKKDQVIPLDVDPINRSIKAPDGLVEFEVAGTHLRLLGMEDANATPTLEQRVAMARRLNEVGPKLPKYVKTIELKKPDFYNAELSVQRSEGKPASSTTSKTSMPASTIANGVPLKKICADINIDPKLARRILRSKGKKPGGRWEWEQKEVDGVKKLLTDEAKKLAEAGKE